MHDYSIDQLDNGLRIISCHMPGMESATIGIWVSAGGRYESVKQQGISHFLEHLLFKGTKKRSAIEISKAVEGVGGSINAYTSEEYTCYFIKVRGKHQDLALDVLLDMIVNSTFKQSEIEKERSVVKEEMNMVIDHPSHYVHELVHEEMWPNHPLGRMLVGNKKSINSIRRKEIIEYLKKHYFPKNMIISAAGNINIKNIVKKTEEYLIKAGNYNNPRTIAFKDAQSKPKTKIVNKQIEQTHVCLGVRAVKRMDSDRYAVKLLSIILGENMSSRLFQTIREKYGLAYDISSGVSFYKDTGGLVVSAGVKPNKMNKFIDLVLREFGKLKRKGVTKTELSRVKDFYCGQLALNFEKTMNRMIWMGENLISTGSVPTVRDVYNSIEKVTIDDIKRISEKIFKRRKLNIAAIGPVKENEELELDL